MRDALPSGFLHDPLTGALTRHRFDEMLARCVEGAAARGAAAALLVIDVDHFKSINDSFGHSRGDAALVEVVRRMHDVLRDGDLLFRFGGDEFVVLLPSAGYQQAVRVSERLLAAASQTPFPGAPPFSLTLSIGAAAYPHDAATPEALFEAADRRVYHAKRAGRGRVVAADLQARLTRPHAPDRLIERDEALAMAYEVLDGHDAALRAICLRASPGAGRTRFLAELARVGVARGYATLVIRGDSALRVRRYGALLSSAAEWPVPAPSAGPAPFAAAIAHAMRLRGASRLLITVDDPSGIDEASHDFLRELLAAPELPRAVLAYVDGPAWARRSPLDAPLQVIASLRPLSSSGIVVWLRQALGWEPPPDMVTRVAAASGGLPRDIHRTLEALIATGALAQRPDGWVWEAHLAQSMARPHAETPAILRQLDNASPLVGRDDEVARLRDLLSSDRLVTIVGQGGVGKTRLSLQAAAECHADFRDGAHFVPLAGVLAPAHIPAAITAALQLPPVMGSDPHARLAAHLRGREMLLVLDNVEHLADGAPLLAELLRGAPDVRLLLTSRQRLDIPGERVFVLESLTLPNGGVGEASAVELFLQRALQVTPSHAPQEEDAAAVVRICRLLDGLPLAIELAASFREAYTSAEILAAIERSLSFLTNHSHDLPIRHRSLTAVLDSFWELLSRYERRSLHALAVFRGGFTREAARAVADASTFFLDGLASKTFLRRTAGGRFEMHELLRQYAAAKLRARPRSEQRAHDRHSDYYLRLVAEIYAAPDAAWDPYAELDNIRAAWSWALAGGRAAAIDRSLRALMTMLADIGLPREGLGMTEEALARLGGEAAPAVRANLHVMRGLNLYYIGRYADALAAVAEADTLIEAAEAPLVLALGHFVAGSALMILGDRARAQARLEQALALAGGDERLAVEALYTLTHLANLAGDVVAGGSYGAETLRRARAAGFRRSEHQAQLFLGIGMMFAERHAEARAMLEPLVGPAGGPRQVIIEILALANMAQVSWELQEYGRAAAEAERSIGLARRADMRYLEGIGLRVRGIVALSCGGLAQAEAAFGEALAIFRATAAQRDAARVHCELALLEHCRGAHGAALAAADEALAIARERRMAPVIGHALLHRGHALLGLGEPAAAADSYREARAQLAELGRRNRAAEALAGVVEAEMAAGMVPEALAGGRELLAHLARGRAALSGMYDPARVCLAAHDALRRVDLAGARAAWGCGLAVLDRCLDELGPERAHEAIGVVASLRRLSEMRQGLGRELSARPQVEPARRIAAGDSA